MTAIRLDTKLVEKPWGRTGIPSVFPPTDGRKIGEIWFDGPQGRHPPLLVKYIFTSENLSIQVHPDDAEAAQRGLQGGKSECWYILDAEPDARLGIGTLAPLDGDMLRASALDGSIEAKMDWKRVAPGAFFYIPAGTVHAIGAGVTLVEVQQNNDVTYRLYDYGRPRELHLDDGVAVSKAEPYALPERTIPLGSEERLVDGVGKPFTLDMMAWDAGQQVTIEAGQSWFIPLSGTGLIDGQPWSGSECWLIDGAATLAISTPTQALVARI
ncbi:class I mannose-6-phosphate isomerase [Sphingobium aquiterrae]|uniref:class I mannose-6-phosphate isomerase n=1 Tax=Sphingobium aquiterrae TaxID=2038656 RepID=UPI0030178751